MSSSSSSSTSGGGRSPSIRINFVFYRHQESVSNYITSHRTTGSEYVPSLVTSLVGAIGAEADPPLTVNGIQNCIEAAAVAQGGGATQGGGAARRSRKYDFVFCSTLARAMQSALLTCPENQVIIAPHLKEEANYAQAGARVLTKSANYVVGGSLQKRLGSGVNRLTSLWKSKTSNPTQGGGGGGAANPPPSAQPGAIVVRDPHTKVMSERPHLTTTGSNNPLLPIRDQFQMRHQSVFRDVLERLYIVKNIVSVKKGPPLPTDGFIIPYEKLLDGEYEYTNYSEHGDIPQFCSWVCENLNQLLRLLQQRRRKTVYTIAVFTHGNTIENTFPHFKIVHHGKKKIKNGESFPLSIDSETCKVMPTLDLFRQNMSDQHFQKLLKITPKTTLLQFKDIYKNTALHLHQDKNLQQTAKAKIIMSRLNALKNKFQKEKKGTGGGGF